PAQNRRPPWRFPFRVTRNPVETLLTPLPKRGYVQRVDAGTENFLLRVELREQRVGRLQSSADTVLESAEAVVERFDIGLQPFIGLVVIVLLQPGEAAHRIGDLGELLRQRAKPQARRSEKVERRGDPVIGESCKNRRIERDLAVRSKLHAQVREVLDGPRPLIGNQMPQVALNLAHQEIAAQQSRARADVFAYLVDQG